MYLLYVSIPYGKGKEDLGIIRTGLEFITYQFPMGKVKKINNGRRILYETYQFPMGKVKKYMANGVMYIETLVSIPYGKGKEQHFVFTVYTQNTDLSTDNLPVLFLEVGFVTKSYLFC